MLNHEQVSVAIKQQMFIGFGLTSSGAAEQKCTSRAGLYRGFPSPHGAPAGLSSSGIKPSKNHYIASTPKLNIYIQAVQKESQISRSHQPILVMLSEMGNPGDIQTASVLVINNISAF